ncbi:hypothetical protein J7E38_21280 [Bacillus sp. ISL-35]|uniref:hypothetical protein n=1 Tax=Bacillus sp. ISL-35 TaxID=2819122 RepID=UPI001BE8FDBE|nr:hypothetical protein [Bacillus sp. ISL-35]MBT2681504.1 hypothetical protein [Bacillus sp. ISL-35]MBT2705689.1 hypothetical protein [Chryseobacterium sp. ISL-80]
MEKPGSGILDLMVKQKEPMKRAIHPKKMNFYKNLSNFKGSSVEIDGSFVLNSLVNRYNNKK